MADNTRLPSEAQIARDLEQILAVRLPPDWSLAARTASGSGSGQFDALLEITSPEGTKAVLAVEVKRVLEPRFVREATRLRGGSPEATPVLAAAYLSPRTRDLLTELGVGYVDTTGNVRIMLRSPGLFISTHGSDRDPWPDSRDLQSLRGRGAARAIRAIVDTTPPFGVRELSSTTGASAPTISRVLRLLERDAIVTREPRGPVVAVDWLAAIRRWAADYDQVESNTSFTYLEPRGLPALEQKLADTTINYAATGAFAAQRFDPIAPARTGALYIENAATVAETLDLRETDVGANVVLMEPFDSVVYDRTVTRGGLRCVAPSQLAVDLLTGPGREPSQGEALLDWMKDNERAWRT